MYHPCWALVTVLKYQRQYGGEPRVTIEEFFNAPVHNHKCQVYWTDSMLLRFSRLVYDLVAC